MSSMRVAFRPAITHLPGNRGSVGLLVIPQMLVRRERWPGGYGIEVSPLVQTGQYVQPDQPVMRVTKAAHISNAVGAQFIAPASSGGSYDLGRNADAVGAPFMAPASSSGSYELGRRAANRGESSNGEIVPAGLRGKVVGLTQRGGMVVESHAALVRGALGVGQQVAGALTMWQDTAGGHTQFPIPPGALLVVPGPLNFALLRQAVISGVSGVIASSIATRDLEGFLHTDLLQLMDSVNAEVAQMYLPPLTLLLTEGPGAFAMPQQTIQLLRKYQGLIALLTGTTSVRQRIFPELLISLPEDEAQHHGQPTQLEAPLIIGAQVRICHGKYEGMFGAVDYLFAQQQLFASGIRAYAARVRLEDGTQVVAPLAALVWVG